MPSPTDPTRVAVVHDYLTQRGGAERVVTAVMRAFPGAPLYTSFFDPDRTLSAFREEDVRPMPLNRVRPLRSHHRAALPILACAFSRLEIAADVVICSSSGWSHGARTSGRKIVYCHSPAKWLYRPQDYLGEAGRLHTRAALAVLHPLLLGWDRRAAASADLYLANSSFVARQIREVYGLEAEVVHPPVALDAGGPQEEVRGLEPGYFLAVSRLLPYKNVAALVAAFAGLPAERLVIVGEGPLAATLRTGAPRNVSLLGSVSDERLRWLYGACTGLVAASREDLGLTPLEAASFGKPVAVLRWGGFLDTVEEGTTGVFFDDAAPAAIAAAVEGLISRSWDRQSILAQAGRFSEEAFAARLQSIVGSG